MWQTEKYVQDFGGESEGMRHVEDLGVDGKIVLKTDFHKQDDRQ